MKGRGKKMSNPNQSNHLSDALRNDKPATFLQEDGLHPNEQGAQAIGSQITHCLESIPMTNDRIDMLAGFALLGILIHNANPANLDRNHDPDMEQEVKQAVKYAYLMDAALDEAAPSSEPGDY